MSDDMVAAIGIFAGISTLLLWSFALPGFRNGGMFIGADGRPSASKFQWYLWTGIVFSSYLAIYLAYTLHGGDSACGCPPHFNIPEHLFWAMGISTGSMAGAKGITSLLSTNQTLLKTTVPPPAPQALPGAKPGKNEVGWKYLFCDDDGAPDLSKVQMLLWTFMAIVIYLWCVLQALLQPKSIASDFQFPDIDQNLLALMGLGHAGYLAKKAVTSDNPALHGIQTSGGLGQPAPGGLSLKGATTPMRVTLTGADFGNAQDGNYITFDGLNLSVTADSWADTKIVFPFPAQQANGQGWTPGQKVQIGIVVGGKAVQSQLSLVVPA